MRFKAKHYVGALAILVLAIPVWAGKDSSRTDSAEFDTSQVTTIGKAELQPGHYKFEAKELQNQLEVLHDGKVIATVPCHWIQLTKKSQNSELQSDKNRINEVEFQGRTEAVMVG